MTQLDAIVRNHDSKWVHPSKSFGVPSHGPIEPALRLHIAHLRPDWTAAEVDAEVALWLSQREEWCSWGELPDDVPPPI
jgi:hypothetical protein